LNPQIHLWGITMRIICLTIIFILICFSYTAAQDEGQQYLSATITLHSGTDLETLYELSPGTDLTLIAGNTYSLKLRPADLGFLRSLGFDVSISGGRTQRQVPRPAILFSSTDIPNSFIQEIVNAVEKESLRTTIQKLQGFGTRYEYTPTQDSAGAYIYKQFEQWGLDVVYDSFALGTATIYDVDYISQNIGWVCGTSGLIAYTTNGGSNWSNQTSGFTNSFYGVDFISSTTGWVVSDGGVILRSTNGGVTWGSQSSPVSSTLYDVNFINNQIGLIVGVSGKILRTTDGGVNWTSITSGTTNTLRKVTFVDSLHAWVVGGVAGSSGIVLRSTDGGLSWSTQSIPSSSSYLRGVCFIDSLHGWAAGDGPTILKTTDGGMNWIAKTPPSGAGTILRGVSFLNVLEGWIGDYYGQLLHTTDGGESWSISYTPPGGIYVVDLNVFSSQRITVVGTSSTIITSTDGGATWFPQTSNLPGQFFHHTQNVVATLQGQVTPEKECIIVGHYDSYSNNPYVSAPGANDNATGTSAVMEAARICRDYRFCSTIKFLVVSAEELGLYGSKHYASEAQAAGRNIVGVVNGDMLGYPSTSDSSRIVIDSYQTRSWLLDSAIVYNVRYNLGLNLVDVVDNSAGSDHVPFTNAGYNALEVAEATAEEIWGGSDPYYHQTTDSLSKLNMGMVWNGARLMITTLTELAQPISHGEIQRPGFGMTPTAIDFGNIPLGNSKIDSVTISNPGTDTLLILSASTDVPEFSILPSTETIAPGNTAKFYITFTPTAVGSAVGNGIFIHNAADTADSVHLTGIGTSGMVVMTHIMQNGWNLVSLPLLAEDMSKATLFPTAISDAFGYTNMYLPSDSLILHKGYWLKFASSQSVSMTGYEQISGTVEVNQGWNMIGTFSSPISVAEVASNPSDLITSQFFDYDNTYRPRDTLEPWQGYWVKVSSPGTLIFSPLSSTKPSPKNAIKIVATDELPPLPPDVSSPGCIEHPTMFELGQAYPNPFNPSTMIKYTLPTPSHVTILVYNSIGQRVALLVDDVQDAGYREVPFDATGLSSGVYFYRMQAGTFIQIKKLLLLK
jgi:photosystem II stability/assembly factor-like uncharacterized protein